MQELYRGRLTPNSAAMPVVCAYTQRVPSPHTMPFDGTVYISHLSSCIFVQLAGPDEPRTSSILLVHPLFSFLGRDYEK